ncbi:ethanolamine ammonia-lyase light chain EutC [Sporosarcina limicola]|uniref:ethanolamine ammonia-lyase light chain EutC n=1 Tax=Sporosarcina limicola TaxID=34101 RepID=UPI00178A36A3
MEENNPDLFASLVQGPTIKGIRMRQFAYIKIIWVWVQGYVSSLVDCALVISLIGEKPGLAASKNLITYFRHKQKNN